MIEKLDVDHLRIINIDVGIAPKDKDKLKRKAWESVYLIAHEEQMKFLGNPAIVFSYMCDQYGIIYDITHAAIQCNMSYQNFMAIIKKFERDNIVKIHKSKSERHNIVCFTAEFMEKIKEKLIKRINSD